MFILLSNFSEENIKISQPTLFSFMQQEKEEEREFTAIVFPGRSDED